VRGELGQQLVWPGWLGVVLRILPVLHSAVVEFEAESVFFVFFPGVPNEDLHSCADF